MARVLRTCVGLGFMLSASGLCTSTAASELVPRYERLQLDNGLTVLLLEHHELPLVDFELVCRGGASLDPSGKEGLADLTMAMLRRGTRRHTTQQLAEEFDFLGATLDLGADAERATLSAQFLAKDADAGLGLLAELLTQPTFPAAEFDKERNLRIDGIREAKDNPRRVLGTYYEAFLFAEHPYGRPVGGSETSLADLTRDDVTAFHERWMRPDNAILAVVGDFRTADMRRLVRQHLGAWERGGRTVPEIPAPQPVRGRRVLLVDKPDAVQTYFRFGNVGVRRGDPDEPALAVVNTVFGGRFTSWLMDALRTKSGLTYNAHARFRARRVPGPFYVSSFTRVDATEKALDMALGILDRLHEQGLDADEIRSAQNYIRGQFPPRFETSGQLARALAELEFYGLDRSVYNTFTQHTDAVDVATARRMIDAHYPREDLVFVLIGPAERIADIARKYGEVTTRKITDPGFGNAVAGPAR